MACALESDAVSNGGCPHARNGILSARQQRMTCVIVGSYVVSFVLGPSQVWCCDLLHPYIDTCRKTLAHARRDAVRRVYTKKDTRRSSWTHRSTWTHRRKHLSHDSTVHIYHVCCHKNRSTDTPIHHVGSQETTQTPFTHSHSTMDTYVQSYNASLRPHISVSVHMYIYTYVRRTQIS